nr:MAG TPA: copper transport outer membrane protein [Caudoviricetes sp.]
MAATLGTFAIFIAIFVGLSLAIAAIRKHIQKIKENSPEGQLKKAREETEKLNTALENTKSQVEELTSAFDKYDEVKNRIADCVKGTKEWEEALDALNKQVLEILTKYPELVKYVERDPLTGELGFSNDYEKNIRN